MRHLHGLAFNSLFSLCVLITSAGNTAIAPKCSLKNFILAKRSLFSLSPERSEAQTSDQGMDARRSRHRSPECGQSSLSVCVCDPRMRIQVLLPVLNYKRLGSEEEGRKFKSQKLCMCLENCCTLSHSFPFILTEDWKI